jgi:hypothetical protein
MACIPAGCAIFIYQEYIMLFKTPGAAPVGLAYCRSILGMDINEIAE